MKEWNEDSVICHIILKLKSNKAFGVVLNIPMSPSSNHPIPITILHSDSVIHPSILKNVAKIIPIVFLVVVVIVVSTLSSSP